MRALLLLALVGCIAPSTPPDSPTTVIAVVDPNGDPLMATLQVGEDAFTADGQATIPVEPPFFLIASAPGSTRECIQVEDDTTITLYPRKLNGSWSGTFDDPPAYAGLAGPVWDPHAMGLAVDTGLMQARFDGLYVHLSWENTPQGSGDLGIAVGDEEYRYWNQEYQTSLGRFEEDRTITWDDLEGVLDGAAEWRVGPSVSTGHYAATGIAYDVEWELILHDGPACEVA